MPALKFKNDTSLALIRTRGNLNPLSLFKPFSKMIKRLLKYGTFHALGPTLDDSSIFLNLLNRAKIPGQLPRNNFRFFSLFKVNARNDFLIF